MQHIYFQVFNLSELNQKRAQISVLATSESQQESFTIITFQDRVNNGSGRQIIKVKLLAFRPEDSVKREGLWGLVGGVCPADGDAAPDLVHHDRRLEAHDFLFLVEGATPHHHLHVVADLHLLSSLSPVTLSG